MSRIRPIHLLSILAACAIATPSAAAAAADSTAATVNPSSARLRDALSGPARAAFDRATTLFRVGNFDAARVEFDQAFALSGEPRLLYNVAVCDKELKRYARAIEELERSLELGGGRLTRTYVRRVRQTIEALQPFVTTLAIDANQSGAVVYVDGERVGVTPLDHAVRVDVGEREVRLDKEGYRHEPVKVRAAGGAPAAVQVALEPMASLGDLAVRATGLPRGVRAEVFIDGARVGSAPWEGQVEAGQRRVEVRAPGYRSVTQTQTVERGGKLSAVIDLEGQDSRARLRVETDDSDNTIFLDGRVIGRGRFEGQVSAGEHALRVVRDGAESYSTDVVLRDRETRSMNVTLTSSGGIPVWVWIAGGAVVAGATTATILWTNRETQYDGQSAGTLPPRVVPASYNFRGL